MSQKNSLSVIEARHELTADQVDLLKRTICKGASNDELKLFTGVCSRTGLDPFAKQIYAVKRWNSKEQRDEMAIQISIDGFRLTAVRTGQYEGQVGPEWCGSDGVWRSAWLENIPPVAARVGIWRSGFREPLWGFARFEAYKQTNKSGQLTSFWQKMPELMIAKVAESLALRKAFPMELSGLYTEEEMDQAENPEKPPTKPIAPDVVSEAPKPLATLPKPRDIEMPKPKQAFWTPHVASKISDAQRRLLFAVAGEHKVPDSVLKEICGKYGYTSRNDIMTTHFEEILEAVKAH